MSDACILKTCDERMAAYVVGADGEKYPTCANREHAVAIAMAKGGMTIADYDPRTMIAKADINIVLLPPVDHVTVSIAR